MKSNSLIVGAALVLAIPALAFSDPLHAHFSGASASQTESPAIQPRKIQRVEKKKGGGC